MMIYEVSDNRITINNYFIEQGTNNIIYVYTKGLKLIESINIDHSMSYEEFKTYCNNYVMNKG